MALRLSDTLLHFVLFSLHPSLKTIVRQKKNFKNLPFLPESLGAMFQSLIYRKWPKLQASIYDAVIVMILVSFETPSHNILFW